MPLYPRGTLSEVPGGGTRRRQEPLWREWDRRANKTGFRKAITAVNGDIYVGEWLNNMKHGTGTITFKSTGAVYEGDWFQDKPHGYGTYSVPRKRGSGVLVRRYVGYWENGKKSGDGTAFYPGRRGEWYDGEWRGGVKCGAGKYYYHDGGLYDGQWLNDRQHGRGVHSMGNGDRYEGEWADGKRHGRGVYIHSQTGQIQRGVWLHGVPRTSVITDYCRETAATPTRFLIPQCELVDVQSVLSRAEVSAVSAVSAVSVWDSESTSAQEPLPLDLGSEIMCPTTDQDPAAAHTDND